VAGHQPSGHQSLIADRDGVRKYEAALARIRLIIDEISLDVDTDRVTCLFTAGTGSGHGVSVPEMPYC
jgi:hypothetical protein